MPQLVLYGAAAMLWPKGASLGAPGAATGEHVPMFPIPLLPAAGRQDPPVVVVASLMSLRFGWCLLPPDNAENCPGCCWQGWELLAGARSWVGCAGRGLLFQGLAAPGVAKLIRPALEVESFAVGWYWDGPMVVWCLSVGFARAGASHVLLGSSDGHFPSFLPFLSGCLASLAACSATSGLLSQC